ncbi:MAG TPA: GNAT family N-acetyltransferase [Candidatus Acidoferrales bacterium]|nr:GNAT family N-acetyltransferase [Candidatus Acidoferrales bacterium]
MTVRRAEFSEAPEVMRVINAAFKPAESFFVDGDRIDLEQVRAFFEKGVFLVTDDLSGCVYIELRGPRAYFGLLSVDPARQGNGVGKRLITQAEEYARAHGSRFMDIRVVNLRVELPPFYRSLGYLETGTEEFPSGESPTKIPCHFVCMSKAL